jgi:protein FrlC
MSSATDDPYHSDVEVSGVSNLSLSRVAAMGQAFIYFPLEFFLDAAAREGLGAVEIWGGAPHLCLEDWTPSRSRWLRHELEARELQLACYTPELVMYPINIAAAEEPLRERSVQYFLRHLGIAADLGATQMLISSGHGYLTEPFEDAWARSRESLMRVARAAQAEGTSLALETLQPRETNLVNTLASAKRMLDELDSPAVHSCLDTETVEVVGDTVLAYFEVLGPRVGHVHLTDGERGRLGAGHLAWGDGNLPLAEYLQVLETNRYAGFLTLEALNSRYIHDPDVALRKGVSALRAFL